MSEADPSSQDDDIYLGDSEAEDTVYAEYEPRFGRFWIPVVAVLVLVILIVGLIVLFFVISF